MSLPKLNVPTYKTKLPISQIDIEYRPFLVKEGKLIMMALTEEDNKKRMSAFMYAAINIVQNCIVTKNVDVKTLPTGDFEWIFAYIRKVSKAETVDIKFKCEKCGKPILHSIDIEKEMKIADLATNKISLSDSVGIVLKYPTMQDLIKQLEGISEGETQLQSLYKSVKLIWEGDQTHTDFTFEDFEEFIEDLDNDNMKKIDNFFKLIPTVYVDVDVTCQNKVGNLELKDSNNVSLNDDREVCGHVNKVYLRGMHSFLD